MSCPKQGVPFLWVHTVNSILPHPLPPPPYSLHLPTPSRPFPPLLSSTLSLGWVSRGENIRRDAERPSLRRTRSQSQRRGKDSRNVLVLYCSWTITLTWSIVCSFVIYSFAQSFIPVFLSSLLSFPRFSELSKSLRLRTTKIRREWCRIESDAPEINDWQYFPTPALAYVCVGVRVGVRTRLKPKWRRFRRRLPLQDKWTNVLQTIS